MEHKPLTIFYLTILGEFFDIVDATTYELLLSRNRVISPNIDPSKQYDFYIENATRNTIFVSWHETPQEPDPAVYELTISIDATATTEEQAEIMYDTFLETAQLLHDPNSITGCFKKVVFHD